MSIAAQYLKASEVAEILNMDRTTVYKMCDEGEIPSIRVGAKARRIPKAAFEAYLRRQAGEEMGPGEAMIRSLSAAAGDADAGRALEDRIVAFSGKVGCSAHEFVDRWRAGEIEDSGEASSLLIEALGLREALDRVGAELVPA